MKYTNTSRSVKRFYQTSLLFMAMSGLLGCAAEGEPQERVGMAPSAFRAATTTMNLDNSPDLIWQKQDTGELAVWFLENNLHSLPDATVGPAETSLCAPSSGWEMKGTADFNGDSTNDLLWYNGSTGRLSIWTMNGTTHLDDLLIGPESTSTLRASEGWDIVNVSYIDFDFWPDILWHNRETGQLAIWHLGENGEHLPGDSVIGPANTSWLPDSTGWRLHGVRDFDGNASPDLLWYNGNTGKLAIWYMLGSTHLPGDAEIGPASISTLPSSTGWELKGVDDFDGDYNFDLLWYNGNTGTTAIWYLNGATHIDRDKIVGPSWNSTLPASAGWKLLSR
ncbi:MAG TPA: hypothetical protein VIV60_26365 [Polyangiaceae bacterium]